MRLSTIKLSGFKSFVDPTVLHLPTNMTGVVGPNGCGKSNIIDAVRWVMGESSASRWYCAARRATCRCPATAGACRPRPTPTGSIR